MLKHKEDAWAFWEGRESFKAYAEDRHETSKWLVETIDGLGLPKSAKILELGCNCGRNLHFLHEAGYTSLTGIDINRDAIAYAKHRFPMMARQAALAHCQIEEAAFRWVGEYDLIYTVAVLEHIHPESEAVFRKIAGMLAPKGWLLTVEDEHNDDRLGFVFPRNYGLFEDWLKPVTVANVPIPGLKAGYVVRTFQNA